MTKEEKLVVIDSLAEQLNEYPHFYITNIEALNAEPVSYTHLTLPTILLV